MIATETESLVAEEYAKMTPTQKLASLLLMLNANDAASLMKHLDERELEAVSGEMAKITVISQEMQKEILRDFSGVAIEAASAINGGVKTAKRLLEQSVGMHRASDILGRVSQTPPPLDAMQEIIEIDARNLYGILRHEPPQTIALVTSYLSSDKASALLAMFTKELREEVIMRLIGLQPTSIEVVEEVAGMLRQKFLGNRPRPMTQTGGVKVAAQLLNALPRGVSDSILVTLRERNPELGDAVLKKMLTFEELGKLDVVHLQKVMREVDTRQLAIALKPANDKLRDKLLSALSKRAGETVKEEIGFLGPLKVSEIDAAQMEIVEIVRRLEAEGTIDLESIRGTSH